MKILKILLITLLGITLSLPVFANPANRPFNGGGSGYFASDDGYVITNQHVVAKSVDDKAIVQLRDGTMLLGRIVYVPGDKDVAIIKVNTHPSACLKISKHGMNTGDRIIALMLDRQDNQPFLTAEWIKLSATIKGTAYGVRTIGSSFTVYGPALTNPFSRPGNSGSAVISPTTHEVVGMIFAGDELSSALLQSTDIHTTIYEYGQSIVCTKNKGDPLNSVVRILVFNDYTPKESNGPSSPVPDVEFV